MALRLDQISKSATNKVKPESDLVVEKKIVRPWANNESSSNIYAGQMAFKRSQEIKSKNNSLVEQLRMEASPKNIQNIENLIKAKELEFENLEKTDATHRRIKTNEGFFYKIKNLFID